MIYDQNSGLIHAVYDHYYDREGSKGLRKKPQELDALVKNIYKILMSRGVYGCYIYCTNKDLDLEAHLRSRLSLKK